MLKKVREVWRGLRKPEASEMEKARFLSAAKPARKALFQLQQLGKQVTLQEVLARLAANRYFKQLRTDQLVLEANKIATRHALRVVGAPKGGARKVYALTEEDSKRLTQMYKFKTLSTEPSPQEYDFTRDIYKEFGLPKAYLFLKIYYKHFGRALEELAKDPKTA